MPKTKKKIPDGISDRLVQQLIDVNEQLEQFAYVASHDLREPLRIIVCFTDLLAKEYGSKLDETGRKYLEINRQAAKKMESMVADLLEYGRIGKTPQHFVETSCNIALEQAVEALGESIKSARAKISSDALPTVRGNRLDLSRLFQNLISNAIKYQKPNTPPLIKISVADKKDHWEFAVADNGIGIENKYLEPIFEPFKRLHSDNEYAGTGIGLAICKKIVENFGGKIWAKSSQNGSTFYFTLPKKKL